MNNQDYIKAGVELADGWKIVRATDTLYVQSPFTGLCLLAELSQGEIDALAAQLVRQVYALEGHQVGVGGEANQHNRVLVYGPKFRAFLGHVIADENGPNRTMNTIKAIVNSEVLT